MTDIPTLDAAWLKAHRLPKPDAETDKNARGRVLVVGGARFVPGALRLTGEAALRVGAGKLQLATVASVALALGVLVPEAAMIALPADAEGEIDISSSAALDEAVAKCDTLILGPGMSEGEDTIGSVRRLISGPRTGLSIVLDAAAINAASELGREISAHDGRVILTPHFGELAALTGASVEAIADDPLRCALNVARQLNAIVVLKSATTIIACPSGQCLSLKGDCVGLATGGSGDVLAGLIGGLTARGTEPFVAAAWGVWLHNACGHALADEMGMGFLARQLVDISASILHAFERTLDAD